MSAFSFEELNAYKDAYYETPIGRLKLLKHKVAYWWRKRKNLREYRIEHAKKTQEYRSYIIEHKSNVLKAWRAMQEKCKDEFFIYDDCCFWAINDYIQNHDDGKFGDSEFEQYRQYFYPCANDSKDVDAFNTAWKHHYEHNGHHWEHWVNDDGTFKTKPRDVFLYYVEMVVDWTAMGYKFGDTALAYYEKHKNEIKIYPDEVEFVERILRKMAVGCSL